ncbi:Hsp20/alpha crystallin family protein [Streptomyces sp. NL15-2K]|uniref:Hsp20/alpha crystallin family protein n=1 Tax=Streptomyces sp. NL15-2K TaxID=376149 RepID=UPI000F55B90D|nr:MULTISPECIES: Hsp20/alpha crystallin family protein [Actinomycetes]WKX06898.1 Hsp20/alpha crystallin family protein [Kutzneria buriramensis]GCB44075.1 heat shock protein hsp20 [Streptomyces sp. NL15-2K]
MSSMIKRIPGSPPVPDLPDWDEAGFPALNTAPATQGIHVEERLTEGTYELRAELPGMDPDKDIEITVANGVLTLRAEHRETTKRHPAHVRYGHFERLPTGAQHDAATAEYRDGVLTITVPVPEATADATAIPPPHA